ncbi:MAG: hypothetical protein LBF88_06935 [Planctomycetaceae bacterium]|nr:hypothetical protein [Planctomycetaceae bacterium]
MFVVVVPKTKAPNGSEGIYRFYPAAAALGFCFVGLWRLMTNSTDILLFWLFSASGRALKFVITQKPEHYGVVSPSF